MGCGRLARVGCVSAQLDKRSGGLAAVAVFGQPDALPLPEAARVPGGMCDQVPAGAGTIDVGLKVLAGGLVV